MSLWQVERLGRRGDGVAVGSAGRALAALTLPGEEIEGDARDGRIATPRIVSPSPDRVKPVCRHYRACGGCSMMHASEGFTTNWKRQVVEVALAAQGIEAEIDEIHVSPPKSRRRAVLSGRRTKKGALLGFHGRASNMITDLDECHVLHPEIMAALPLLRKLVIAGASRSAELDLTVILTSSGLDVAVNGGKAIDAALFGRLAELADEGNLARLSWGDESITRRPPTLRVGQAQVTPPPGAFLQATVEGEAVLQAAVCDMISGADRIVDLYAGYGTFTLPLSERAELHAVEGLAPPLAALDAGWRAASGLRKVTTEIRDLARRPLLAEELTNFDAIVIDPPRSGAPAQSTQIAASGVSRIAFVSCDPVNFARDARIISDGGYDLTRVILVDQFRWSPHVEIAAEFRHS